MGQHSRSVVHRGFFPVEYQLCVCCILQLFNPRHACAVRVTGVGFVFVCMCVCVCLSAWSIKPHLTSGVSVHPEINITYSTGKGQHICGFFFLRCGDPALPALYDYLCSRPFLLHRKSACALFDHALLARIVVYCS